MESCEISQDSFVVGYSKEYHSTSFFRDSKEQMEF